MKNLIAIMLLLFSNTLFGFSGKIKDEFYTDVNKLFKIKLDKKWYKDITEIVTTKTSAITFFDEEGRSILINIKTLPSNLLNSFKGKEEKVLSVFANELRDSCYDKYKIVIIEEKTVDILNSEKGFYRCTFVPEGAYTANTVIKKAHDAYYGMVFYLKNNKLIHINYIDSGIENFYKVKLNEDLKSINIDYQEKLLEIINKVIIL